MELGLNAGEAKEEDLDRRGVSLSPVAVGVDNGGGERRWFEFDASGDVMPPSKTEEESLPELLDSSDEQLRSESDSYADAILNFLDIQ